jgi:tetratricopeptide (TPR) repeat protein
VLERVDAPRQTRDLLHRLARALAALGDASAVQVYEQTREETEQWGDPQELGQVLCELANVHRDAGRVMPAIQHYQAALEHQPAQLMARDRADTLRNLGRAYAQAERYDEARAVWTEALELSADQPDPSPVEVALTHHAIAEAHRSQGHYHDAELSYHEALNHHAPRTVAAAETWRALGRALREAGRFEEAIEPLRKALEAEKAQPQQANARLVQTLQLLAETQEDCGDVEAAIARYHEVLVYMDRTLQPVAYAETLRILGGLYAELGNYEQAHVALEEALEIETAHVPRSDERISTTLQAIADTYRSAGDLEQAAVYYQKVTVYTNLAHRASDDLRSTLDELERRRATLQAAEQSLALLDRHENASLKDLAFIYALIAHSHAQLNQPQASAGQINTLLDILYERRDDLDLHDTDADRRALAWLADARRAEDEGDPSGAREACASALETARNANLRWVIEQVMQAIE